MNMLKCISLSGLWQYMNCQFSWEFFHKSLFLYSAGLMFLFFLMCLLRKVTKLGILRLGLHYIYIYICKKKNQEMYGNLFWHKCVKCLFFSFLFCLFSLNLIFFPVFIFSRYAFYSRLWNFPTILFPIEKTEIEIKAEIISDFTGLLTIDELYKLHTWDREI